MARQLSFDLPVRAALGREDFFVTEANAGAVAMTEDSDAWPGGKLALCGPEASGKTHLAHVWADRVDGVVVAAEKLGRLDIPTLASAQHVAVEDIPRIAGQRRAENALFHLHNLLLSEGGRLLLTGRARPARWDIALPDLRSRLMGATLVALDPPDDALLAALLKKQFHDRQIRPVEGLVAYLVPRMTRSGAAARHLVATIDRLSLDEARPVSVPLARKALEVSQNRDEDGAEDRP